MNPIHLIRLHEILTLMVKNGNLSVTERDDILRKAGLHYLIEGCWEDNDGVIYTLK